MRGQNLYSTWLFQTLDTYQKCDHRRPKYQACDAVYFEPTTSTSFQRAGFGHEIRVFVNKPLFVFCALSSALRTPDVRTDGVSTV
jgi:hypothetical protein